MPHHYQNLLSDTNFSEEPEKLGVAFTTAQRPIERLERLGIVQQAGTTKSDRVDCAKVLLNILEEPARLAPS